METYRQCVFPKDVERMLGRTIWTARRILQRIRKQKGKTPNQFVTADEFATHTGLPIELVIRYISDGKSDKLAHSNSDYSKTVQPRPAVARERPLSLPDNRETITGITAGSMKVPSRQDTGMHTEHDAMTMAVESLKEAVHSANSFFSDIPDGRLTHRFKKMFERINEGPAQQPCSLLPSRNKSHLLHFELDARKSLLSTFAASITTEHNRERTQAEVHLKNIQVCETLSSSPTAAATHFRLFHIVATISDIIYDPLTQRYRFADHSCRNVSAISESQFVSLTSDPIDITMQTALPRKVLPRPDTTIIQALGLVYFTLSRSKSFPYKKHKSIQIIDVF